MKDAVGSTMLVYIVIIVVGIVGSILIASNMYTSAYKAKNNIVNEIDRYYMVNGNTDCFGEDTDDDGIVSDICKNSIESTFKNMGYHTSAECNKYESKVLSKAKNDEEGNPLVSVSRVYEDSKDKGYCIYKIKYSDDSYYYTVVTFSHLNINVLNTGSLFSNPVYGETRTYYNS